MIETLATTAAVFKALPSGTAGLIAKTFQQTKDKILGRFELTFSNHIETTLRKCAEVQTIFTDETKVPLKSIYTNLYISGSRKIRDDEIIQNLGQLGNIVISGTGGAGKTMLMKYLALSSIENPVGKIPLFIELRNLPQHSSSQFNRTVLQYCYDTQDDQNYNIFREGLLNGLFLIFFDGLDEVPSESREQVFNSIKRMARSFPRCRIIASSRPEIDTRNWGELTTYRVLGMEASQAKHLIEKVNFPDPLKAEFIKLMDPQFFSRHRSFLEVPLLCSLMLLTYHEYQSIPSRITVFYEQAFETLMRRHDRSKEGYFKRELECGLSSDRFRKVFSAFCYRTLAKQEVSFSDGDFRFHLSRAAAATEIEVDIDVYASDLVAHVCVVMRDGLNLHFIHRSFQEYFAAVYLVRYRGGDALSLYDTLFTALNINDVSLMAYDMDVQAFEREWALPACRRIKDLLDNFTEEERPFELLKSAWFSLRFDENDQSFSTWGWVQGKETHETLSHLVRVYGNETPGLSLQFSGSTKSDASLKDLLANYLSEEELTAIYISYIDEESEDFQTEFILSGHNLSWLKSTSMFEDLKASVSAIYALHTALDSRVTQREMIDILS